MKRVYPRHIINFDMGFFALAIKMIIEGKAIYGDYIATFEKKFADYIGISYAIGVDSARKGLFLILKNLNFSENDEVILPAYTFHALPVAVIACNLKPVFVDIDADTSNINDSLIEQSVNAKTKAIIITHMFGQPCNMESIMKIAKKYNLAVIEDCAHACGAKYQGKRVGSLGDAAIFSFKLGKNLPCFGGGMITTNRVDLYNNLRVILKKSFTPVLKSVFKEVISSFLSFCIVQKQIFSNIIFPAIKILSFLGCDYIDRRVEEKIDLNNDLISIKKQTKLINLQAAVGIRQLLRIDDINQKRRINAQALIRRLKKVKSICIPLVIPDTEAIYLYFRIKVQNSKLFRKKLLDYGIDTKRDDMNACSNAKIFEKYKAFCPVAEDLNYKSIEVPNNHLLNEEDIRYIARYIECVSEKINEA